MRTSFSRTAGADGYSVTSHVSANLLQFLNGLPIMVGPLEWIDAFREGLRRLLGDVDRVAALVNTNCRLEASVDTPYTIEIGQYNSNTSPSFIISARHTKAARIEWEEVYNRFRTLGYPVDDYQRPGGFSYHAEGGSYLGSILLFRKKGRGPISEQSLSTMQALEPFIIFLFSSLVTRYVYLKPHLRLFMQGLKEIGPSAELTIREVEVMSLYLFGLSHREIADRLFISEHTVQKHVKSIHRKTSVRNFVGLMSRVLFGEEWMLEQLGLHERHVSEAR